jgi:hypothetical protein
MQTTGSAAPQEIGTADGGDGNALRRARGRGQLRREKGEGVAQVG